MLTPSRPFHRGRLASVAVALVATLIAVVIATTSPTTARPALGESPSPAETSALERWHVTQQVINESPFRLELVSERLTELTHWDVKPQPFVDPGERDVMSFFTDEAGHGLVGIVTYAALDAETGAFVGMVSARSAVDCNTPTPVACLSYHRWEQIVCDGGGAVRGFWTDNAAGPSDFWTEMRIVDGRGGGGACAPGWGEEPGSPAEEPGADPPDQIWGVTASLANDSAYKLRLRNIWNSESSRFQMSPVTPVGSGEAFNPSWMYFNAASGHGPAAVIWYDLYDPEDAYLGSALLSAGIDCVATYITEGCLSGSGWEEAVARAKPGFRADARANGFGIPPLAYSVNFGVVGGRIGLATTPPTEPPAADDASASSSGPQLAPAFTG